MTAEDSSLPWYKNGLKFACTQCGKCCSGNPGYVWVTEQEMQAIADYLKISLEIMMRKYIRQRDNRYALIEKKSQNYDCIFLKDKKCTIYPVRPKQCQSFPWWKENLHSEESWKHASEYCEGINEEAPLVPYTQIVQWLGEKKL